ncbi:Hypothetical predicted protein [Olea europaea subsp. europaea]|uniref:Uncharacterized protein n=1 Tax=Olea europaea subsp. europaea TaxID=158383 RepID=A0A8S0SWA1_OLEEU|nr:Hypothetical predicted protein [Olea europaea subsp. europaea]
MDPVVSPERNEYKEYTDKDCRELYRYKVLFGDVFDYDKYSITPSQASHTDFTTFEDSGHNDHSDEILVDVESRGSSDEDGVAAPPSVWPVVEKRLKEKKKCFSSRDVSYFVDCATSTSEKIAAKIDYFIGAAVSDSKTYMSELLATGRLQKQMDLYFYTCKFLSQKANREVLDMQDNANDKFAWVEWSYQEYRKTQVCLRTRS